MKLCKDILDEVEAKNAIQAYEDVKELQAFIKGERRESLLDVAAFRLNYFKSLVVASPPVDTQAEKPKQGQQVEPITKQTAEFKSSGVEGTKAHTIDNVVLPALRKKGYKI